MFPYSRNHSGSRNSSRFVNKFEDLSKIEVITVVKATTKESFCGVICWVFSDCFDLSHIVIRGFTLHYP